MKPNAIAPLTDRYALPRAASWCGLFVIFLGVSILLAWYLKSSLQVEAFDMLPIAVAFSALGFGILRRVKHATNNTPNTKTLSVPLTVLAGGITVTIILWQSILHKEASYSHERLAYAANQLVSAILADFEANMSALDRMRQRWEFGGGATTELWLKDATNYIDDSRLFDRLFVLDSESRTWLSSKRPLMARTRDALANDTRADERYIELFSSLDPTQDHSFVWHPQRNIFQIIMPIRTSSTATAIVAEVDADRWFEELSQSYLGRKVLEVEGITIDFVTTNAAVNDDRKKEYSMSAPMRIAGRDWQVVVTKYTSWRKNQLLGLATVVLLAGLSVSSLLATALLFWRKMRSDTIELEASNIVLANAYSEKEKAEQHLKLLLDNAAEGIFGLNAAGVTTFVNPVACRMLAIEANDALGKPMHETISKFQLYARNEDSFVNRMCESVEDGQVHAHNNQRLYRKDGSSFLVEYTSTPVFQDDKLTGAVVIFRDISETSNQANELMAINANLLLANTELEEFAYVASHDLRTPLQGIENLVDWIAEDLGENPPPTVSNNLGRVKERISRLQTLIDDLLSYSRATKADHELAQTHLRTMIEDLINDLDKGEDFSCILHGCDREVRIAGTPFQTVLRNLIDNAMKHHDRDTGEVEISVHSVEGGYISVSVIDDGPGIPLDQHQRIFRLFETLNGHKGTAGTGMGLALTKRLVSKYGGEISLAIGDDGRGCCFTFTWPCQLVAASHDG